MNANGTLTRGPGEFARKSFIRQVLGGYRGYALFVADQSQVVQLALNVVTRLETPLRDADLQR
jgi:hypothetical protein